MGDVKNIHYFARDMVLFRNEAGAVGLVDPYCPHLGPHLGYGGEVNASGFAAPFTIGAMTPMAWSWMYHMQRRFRQGGPGAMSESLSGTGAQRLYMGMVSPPGCKAIHRPGGCSRIFKSRLV